MSLDLYQREDIARALAALTIANNSMAAVVHDEQLQDDKALFNYCQGYNDALTAVCAAFGIMPGVAARLEMLC